MMSDIPWKRSSDLCAECNPAERQAMIWSALSSARLPHAIDGGDDDCENVARMGG